MNTISAEQMARNGLSEFQAGNVTQAIGSLNGAIGLGYRHPDVFVALGHALRANGQVEDAIRQFTAALGANPRHLRALLGKADALLSTGQEQQAASLFSAAIKVSPGPDAIPADLRPVFMRGFDLIQSHKRSLEDAIYTAFPDVARLERQAPAFAESLDILLGRKRPYYQEPTRFHYPNLPQRAVYDRAEFAWAEQLEAATDDICTELVSVLGSRSDLPPYLEVDEDTIRLRDSPLIGNNDWGAYYIWKQGALIEEAARLCPRTVAELERVPQDHLARQAPSALFSVLKPGTHIPPHNGMLNTRLICHLPLIVPPVCALRVGNDVIPWKKGELVIFDDSVEHEAWNRSDQTRVVLLFEIWKPELSHEERELLTRLFEILAAEDRSA